jgi:hypothetical protein
MECFEIALEAARLDRAAFREIARIEVEHQPAAGKVAEAALRGFSFATAARHHALQREIGSGLIKGGQNPSNAKGLPG